MNLNNQKELTLWYQKVHQKFFKQNKKNLLITSIAFPLSLVLFSLSVISFVLSDTTEASIINIAITYAVTLFGFISFMRCYRINKDPKKLHKYIELATYNVSDFFSNKEAIHHYDSVFQFLLNYYYYKDLRIHFKKLEEIHVAMTYNQSLLEKISFKELKKDDTTKLKILDNQKLIHNSLQEALADIDEGQLFDSINFNYYSNINMDEKLCSYHQLRLDEQKKQEEEKLKNLNSIQINNPVIAIDEQALKLEAALKETLEKVEYISNPIKMVEINQTKEVLEKEKAKIKSLSL